MITFFNDRIFGTPNHDYPKDILDESSTNGRYSESEMRDYTYPKPRYIPQRSQKPGWPDIQYTNP